jgi:hypothetical protein
VNPEILAAIIGATATLLAAITESWRRIGRVDRKIDGLRNGTYDQAMRVIAELQKEKALLEIAHMRPRRKLDELIP